MDFRKFAALLAAGLAGLALSASASGAPAASSELNVKGTRISPNLQRQVSYRDLDLAERNGEKTLKTRIQHTAMNLCFDLHPSHQLGMVFDCSNKAVHSTDVQVKQAVERAHARIAGLSVGPEITISMVVAGN